MTTIAPSEPTLSQELADIAAEYPEWHFWKSDGGRLYAVTRTRYSGFTVFALDPVRLTEELGKAAWDLEHLSARDERRAVAA